ncbi:MAG: hypothetical protein GY844_24355 [Bradyrhizobium sp.]|nr:hypothetical protein [Bradyrhizobium sp.]
MCGGDDRSCPDFHEHNARLRAELDVERRSFLKSGFVATGGAVAMAGGRMSLVTPALAQMSQARQPSQRTHHYLPANADTVHWGYFSKTLKPKVEIDSGDFVTIESLTHHASDDWDRMIKGDPGVESVYLWTKEKKGVNRRGAGPMDASIHGRGAGEGMGVHIMTGPVYVRNAEPGDILEVRIVDCALRPSTNPEFEGKAFGSNAAANWGFHYNDLLAGKKRRWYLRDRG